MNWFETTSLSSFARSALKEAQRTIDKALDIQDPLHSKNQTIVPGSTQAKLKEESESFFEQFEVNEASKDLQDTNDEDASSVSEATSNFSAPADVSSSFWGSFTGSFFDNTTSSLLSGSPKTKRKTAVTSVVAAQPLQTLSKEYLMSDDDDKTSKCDEHQKQTQSSTKEINSLLSIESFSTLFTSNTTFDTDIQDQSYPLEACDDESEKKESKATPFLVPVDTVGPRDGADWGWGWESGNVQHSLQDNGRASPVNESRSNEEILTLNDVQWDDQVFSTSRLVVATDDCNFSQLPYGNENTDADLADTVPPVSESSFGCVPLTPQVSESSNIVSDLFINFVTDQRVDGSKVASEASCSDPNVAAIDQDSENLTCDNYTSKIDCARQNQAKNGADDAECRCKRQENESSLKLANFKEVDLPKLVVVEESLPSNEKILSFSSGFSQHIAHSAETSGQTDLFAPSVCINNHSERCVEVTTVNEKTSSVCKSENSSIVAKQEETLSTISSSNVSIQPVEDLLFSVQPEKSSLVLEEEHNLTESQASKQCLGASGPSSLTADSEEDSVASTATIVPPDSLVTITKQPVARPFQCDDLQQASDEMTENISLLPYINRQTFATDPLESVLTVQECHVPVNIQNTNQFPINNHFTDSEGMNSLRPETDWIDTPSAASHGEVVLLPLVPLDVSVESGGSSDTITTSMDSNNPLLVLVPSESLESSLQEELQNQQICKDENIGSEHEMHTKNINASEMLNEAMQFDLCASAGPEEMEKNAVVVDSVPVDSAADNVVIEGCLDSDREKSPATSDSLQSEIVKIGHLDHTSDHSSGDDMETTTSSDIEVISSPSMDGASTYSGNGGGGSLFGPAHQTATRVWYSTQQRLKSFLADPSSGRPYDAGSAHEKDLLSPSLTASFTSISESEAGELWSTVPSSAGPPSAGGSVSPPERPCRGADRESQFFERGHTRNQSNMSETSESSSEIQAPELDKLNKKIMLLNETLEARELRAVELSQQNVALQDTNSLLILRIQELESRSSSLGFNDEGALESLREEFTQRLATMEKKFQQALREKENVQKLLDAARLESASRLSSKEVLVQLEERDTVIAELRSEGDKLSKQQLQYSTSLKKLRAKEKQLEATIAAQSTKIESQKSEIERQHKQLVAKTTLERKHVETINDLTAEKHRAEESLRLSAVQNAELHTKIVTLESSLDAAYKEVAEAKRQETVRAAELDEHRLSAELGVRQQLSEALDQQQRQADREKLALKLQLDEILGERDAIQAQADRTEKARKAELLTLQQQLVESEGRGEQLAQAVAAATRPLLRQLESVQATHASQRASWEELEANLTHRLQEAERQAVSSNERERAVREQSAEAIAQKTALQTQVDSLRTETRSLNDKVQNMSAVLSKLEQEKHSCVLEASSARDAFNSDLKRLRCELDVVKTQLEQERLMLCTERKKNDSLQHQLLSYEKRSVEVGVVSRQSSPTPSLSRLSIYSGAPAPWADDVFETSSNAIYGSRSLYEALRGSTAHTAVDALTSQLMQREGELHQMQTEISRHEAQRESLAAELLQLTEQMQQLQQQVAEHERLQAVHEDMEQKYNALLQMYGEKVEEVEELTLDLADVKEMYKAQINQLMQK